jgi:hypothetical protein
MNRTIKDATVKVFHYDNLHSLTAHVLAFVTAYHLTALKWRTPYQVICEAWTKVPAIFKINPHHLTPGPHTSQNCMVCDSEVATLFLDANRIGPVTRLTRQEPRPPRSLWAGVRTSGLPEGRAASDSLER